MSQNIKNIYQDGKNNMILKFELNVDLETQYR